MYKPSNSQLFFYFCLQTMSKCLESATNSSPRTSISFMNAKTAGYLLGVLKCNINVPLHFFLSLPPPHLTNIPNGKYDHKAKIE